MNTQHPLEFIYAGKDPDLAANVVILFHGRGASAQNILPLAADLYLQDYHIIAPQAVNDTWYPYSFMEHPDRNEPWLSSGINMVHSLLADLEKKDFTTDKIIMAGFSQGACLMLESAARYGGTFKALLAFSGGLIGNKLQTQHYRTLSDTPVLLAADNRDPHVPLSRLEETRSELERLGAEVHYRIHPGMGHTILPEDIKFAEETIIKPAIPL